MCAASNGIMYSPPEGQHDLLAHRHLEESSESEEPKTSIEPFIQAFAYRSLFGFEPLSA